MRSGERPTRIEGLDALRGLAVALVLVRHSWPEFAGTAGVVGVVVFFTLSGYLITGLLVRDLEHYGHVRYGRFYRNRAFRLIPALLFLLTAIAVITLSLDPLDDRSGLTRAILVGLTYTANIPFAHGSATVEHLWTLATEEQFYVVWPVILALGVRFRRSRLALAVSAGIVSAALITTIALTYPGVAGIYPLPTSWCLAMVAGAAAHFERDRITRWLPLNSRRTAIASLLALVTLLVIALMPENKGSPLLYLVIGPLIAVASIVLIMQVSAWTRLPRRELRPLLWLGTISYAVYLWNWPIVVWLGPQPLDAPLAWLAIPLTIGAASASWWLVEAPAAKLKRRLERTRPSDGARATILK